MLLQKGENIIINEQKNQLQVQLFWKYHQTRGKPICLLVDYDENLNSVVNEDSDFLKVKIEEKKELYEVDLYKVPNTIKKFVFMFIFENDHLYESLGISTKNGEETISYIIDSSFSKGTFIIGEVYRYKNKWKIKAVGQKKASGIRKRLTNNRFSSNGKDVNIKPALESKKIVVVMDSSIYALDYFQSGELQKIFQEIYIATSTINPTREIEVWFYAVLHQKAVVATDRNYQTYVKEYFPQNRIFNGLGLENQELPLVLELIDEYKDTETIFFFICNGELHNFEIVFETIKNDTKKHFWEFIILKRDFEIIANFATRNMKFLHLSRLLDLQKGELHQSLLKPIIIWGNSKSTYV